MKIAVPISDGKLATHFGHCDCFYFFEINKDNKNIINKEELIPPAHEPGILPAWLKQKGVNCIIAGGMGSRAQGLFSQSNIKVVVGAENVEPTALVENFLEGRLQTGTNQCDH